MLKLRFDDSDYSVVVKPAGPSELLEVGDHRAGRSKPVGESPISFHTMVAANKAGKAALKQLLAKLTA
jgi:hypothetical protein